MAPRLEFHALEVAAVERLTADALAVTLAVPAGLSSVYDFAPGQHLTLRHTVAGQEVRRSYSICSPRGGPLRIAIKAVPAGVFSSYALASLQVGDVVDVLPPVGRFTATFSPGRHYAAIAAGSGITPVLSLLATALADGARCTLLYGNRTAASVMFADELADLKDRFCDRFSLAHVLSREAGALSGRLDAELVGRLADAVVGPADAWFLCGPHGMVTDAQRALAERAVPPDAVHVELFYVEPTPIPRVAAAEETGLTVTVLLDGRTSEVPVAAGERVLDAALRVRPELPFACRGGVCATCRARLLAGEVRMDRNYALEPDELAAGYVLTCQSHPCGAGVVLDYDA
jgi:ring-1,2-phenylacetyl-CoA epoxidase subunit PaaE